MVRVDKNKKARKHDDGHARNEAIRQKMLEKKRFKAKLKEEDIESITSKYQELANINTANIKLFSDLPLSMRTLKGLEECDYINPTEIQRDSLPFTLTGQDVVGAAKTGSGKTLALVIPLLESLWRASWQPEYGLGALIISPTRELALQTFTCINHVGKHHNFSCALLIGGTDVSYERSRLGRINIIICTPGRLLQHMDENENLNCEQLQLLVIDEADRILDMGFKEQINSIICNLPKDRQTLLFSATQTRNIKDLTRVCTKDPVFVFVHENSSHATPDLLKQSYMLCEEHEKMNVLWSFVTNHKKLKTLVFVSSCKQARFITETFSHLRPGVSVMGLWGTMNQTKRIEVFQTFENRKAAVMIATDIASRGLDFSDVDWVIQMDAPSEVDDYIHRVGRTARMERKGNAVMFLTPNQEDGILSILGKKNIPVEKLRVDSKSLTDIRSNLRSVLAQFSELNQYGQKSIVAYLRSVYLNKDKKVFDVQSIDAAALADSYGLVSVPRVRFLSKKGITTKDKSVKETKEDTFVEKDTSSLRKENKKQMSEDNLVGNFAVDVDEEDLLTVKKIDVFNVKNATDEKLPELVESKRQRSGKLVTKMQAAKKIINKGVSLNQRKVFEENGDEVKSTLEDSGEGGLVLEDAISSMKQQDAMDRKNFREKKKLLKKKQKDKQSKKNKTDDGDEIDFAEDGGGSGINSDADLDWLPDPDEVRRRYAQQAEDEMDNQEETTVEPPRKKRKQQQLNVRKTEDEALALLNPFLFC